MKAYIIITLHHLAFACFQLAAMTRAILILPTLPPQSKSLSKLTYPHPQLALSNPPLPTSALVCASRGVAMLTSAQ
jgi:hypothetical protein